MPSNGSFKDFIVYPIKGIPKWADWTDAVSTLFNDNVEAPLIQLENLRYLDENTSLDVLQKTARMLGFNLTEDVLDASNNDLLKIVNQLPLYYDANGTYLFIKFIDLVLNAETEVVRLWTEDHQTFHQTPQGPLLKDGGTWYQSCHVDIYIRLINPSYVVLSSTTLAERIKQLFYQNCPIEITINDFWYVVALETEVTVGAIAKPDDTMDPTLSRGLADWHYAVVGDLVEPTVPKPMISVNTHVVGPTSANVIQSTDPAAATYNTTYTVGGITPDAYIQGTTFNARYEGQIIINTSQLVKSPVFAEFKMFIPNELLPYDYSKPNNWSDFAMEHTTVTQEDNVVDPTGSTTLTGKVVSVSGFIVYGAEPYAGTPTIRLGAGGTGADPSALYTVSLYSVKLTVNAQVFTYTNLHHLRLQAFI